jgi:hypothetical protein
MHEGHDAMMRTVRAIINERGVVQLLESIDLKQPQRALVTILDDEDGDMTGRELALMSEASLAKDWNRPEEDEAWSHLQSEPLS